MKKTKFLALTLVVAMMLVGAGYAYWTQDLVIENNISTGELDVIFANPDLDLPEGTYINEESFKLGSDNYNLELNLSNAYPGADFSLTFDLDNEGTLGANVRSFEVVEDELANLVLVRRAVVGTTELTLGGTSLAHLMDALNAEDIFVEKNNEDGQIVQIVIDFEIDPSITGDDFENDEISFTINAKAYQYNDATDR